jgi:hypothetical protein
LLVELSHHVPSLCARRAAAARAPPPFLAGVLTFNEFADKAKSMGYAESNARMASFRREIGEIRRKML